MSVCPHPHGTTARFDRWFFFPLDFCHPNGKNPVNGIPRSKMSSDGMNINRLNQYRQKLRVVSEQNSPEAKEEQRNRWRVKKQLQRQDPKFRERELANRQKRELERKQRQLPEAKEEQRHKRRVEKQLQRQDQNVLQREWATRQLRKDRESPGKKKERLNKDRIWHGTRYRVKRSIEMKTNDLRTRSIRRSRRPRHYDVTRGQRQTERLSNIHSFLVRNILQRKRTDSDLDELGVVLDFLNDMFHNFDDLAYLMMPDKNKKKGVVRLSIEFPQAMRVFFGKTVMTEVGRGGIIRAVRPAYGLTSILATTGMRPNDLRVRPFNSDIDTIILYLEKAVSPYLEGTKYEGSEFDFNFMEAKLYFGNNFVTGNSNQSVGAHTDCQFNDKGQQLESDSARGDHLTLVLAIGEPRMLYFVRCSKTKGEAGWLEAPGKYDYLHLSHNSLFVLFPEDEIPTMDINNGNLLRKVKHGVKFYGKNCSVALVFRAVKKFAAFYTGVTGSNEENPPKKDSWDYNTPIRDDSGAQDFSPLMALRQLEMESRKKDFEEAEANMKKEHLSEFGEGVIRAISRFSEIKNHINIVSTR